MLTAKSHYAVLAMISISQAHGIIGVSSIANKHHISVSFLERILTMLRRNQLLESVKGPGGGYKLSKNASKITMRQIIDAVDGNTNVTRCLNEANCNNHKSRCSAHVVWEHIEHLIGDYLESVTLDYVANHSLKMTEVEKNDLNILSMESAIDPTNLIDLSQKSDQINLERRNVLYLDHNASTPMLPSVVVAIKEILEGDMNLQDRAFYSDHSMSFESEDIDLNKYQAVDYKYANPSSIHSLGRNSAMIIDDARQSISRVFNFGSSGKNYKIIFTGSGTEANNLIIHAATNNVGGTVGLVTSAIEHHSIINAAHSPHYIGVNKDGLIDIDQIEQFLLNFHAKNISESGKLLFSIMMVNNETGVIQPIKKIAEIVHKFGHFIHSDCVCACGKIPIDIYDLGIDAMTISAHKFGGPKGVGALIVSNELSLLSQIQGGKQQYGLRAGTENIYGIKGMQIALDCIEETLKSFDRTRLLRDFIDQSIQSIDSKAIIFGKNAPRVPNTTYVYMPKDHAEGVSGVIQLMHLDLCNIAVSAGSACEAGMMEKSHVLYAMGIQDHINQSSIRISFGPGVDQDDVYYFLKCWERLYRRCNVNNCHV